MADYVNNKQLYQTLIEYKKQRDSSPEKHIDVPIYVCECFMLIAERIGRRDNFRRYSYLDEMRLDAIEDCIKYVTRFDIEKYDNPFGYFSKIIWQAFLRRIEKEKKQTAIKGALMRNVDVSSFDTQDHDLGEDWSKNYQSFINQYSSFDIPYPTRKKAGSTKKVKTEEELPLNEFIKDSDE